MAVELLTLNKKIYRYLRERIKNGKVYAALKGGRRSGKTYGIAQKLIIDVFNDGDIVNVASMTMEQGRLGAYADFCNIINSSDGLRPYFRIYKSPRQIECLHNGGKIYFNSYSNSETAKGIACDWLFINEANNFTKQQVIDLMANARKGVIFDFNPNIHFWITDFVPESEMCVTTWKDNINHLPPAQIEYFKTLRRLGTKPDANPIDVYNYKVYYLGEYAEIRGQIFYEELFTFLPEEEIPKNCSSGIVFVDPSAMRGADYLAAVLSFYCPDTGKVYIRRTITTNDSTRPEIAKQLLDWCKEYDISTIYIETNGIIGQEFYEYCANSGLPVQWWYSSKNKYQRIISKFDLITSFVITDTEENRNYLKQCYTFAEKCEHDDNIDALASTAYVYKYNGIIKEMALR